MRLLDLGDAGVSKLAGRDGEALDCKLQRVPPASVLPVSLFCQEPIPEREMSYCA